MVSLKKFFFGYEGLTRARVHVGDSLLWFDCDFLLLRRGFIPGRGPTWREQF